MLGLGLALATTASKVTSGAVLTLVLPLGLTLVALAIWWFMVRGTPMHRGTKAIRKLEEGRPPPPAE